jgi:hypothetical protein
MIGQNFLSFAHQLASRRIVMERPLRMSEVRSS